MSTLALVNPKVSVLLASFNGADWIEEQISSIMNQTNVNIHLTISDDQSNDGTVEYLQQKQTHQSFTLLSAAKSGSAAQNFFRLLIEQDLTQVEYVAFSDQDDIWLSQKLDIAIQAISLQKADAYSSNVKAFWQDGRSHLINKAQPQTNYDYMFESAGPGCTFVITQKLATELQTFLRDNRAICQSIALHDWFIYAFSRSKGYSWYIDPTPNLLYRQHDGNAIGANSGLKAIKARLVKLKQGWYIQQILLIANALDYQDKIPLQRVRRLNIFDRVFLAASAHQFRRRLRDRFAFVLFILFLARKQ
jgi:rhamnosyltransferase